MGGVCCARRENEHDFMENGVEGNICIVFILIVIILTDKRLQFKSEILRAINKEKLHNEVLQDQINQKNNYEEDLKKKEQENQEKYSEDGIKFRQKMIKLGGVLVFLVMAPFLISFRTKLQLERKAKEAYEKKI